jgi:hypothetical protein
MVEMVPVNLGQFVVVVSLVLTYFNVGMYLESHRVNITERVPLPRQLPFGPKCGGEGGERGDEWDKRMSMPTPPCSQPW